MVLPIVIAATVSAFLLVLGRWLTRATESDSSRIERILSGEAIASYYRPMERLLSEDDWQYLSARPGFSPARIRKLRANRRDLFRSYLDSLSGDFAAMCMVVRALMVQSATDQPDLAKALSAARRTFYLAMFRVRLSLMGHALGLPSVHIEVAGLTRALEELAAQARSLQLVPQPNFA